MMLASKAVVFLNFAIASMHSEQSVDRQYKGREFATELPLNPDMTGLLALEAEFLGMNIECIHQ
jgi:hypothetical protein